jgi:hypothetical protein
VARATDKPPSKAATGGTGNYITLALNAGFVELAYGLTALAGVASVFRILPDNQSQQLQMFRWVLLVVAVGAGMYLALDIAERAAKRFMKWWSAIGR